MVLVRKTIARVGHFVTPDGPIDITPARIAHWARQFQKQISRGIEVPVPWGHQRAARPGEKTNPDHVAYMKSKYNAGYLKNLSVAANGNELQAVVECPALKVDGGGHLIDPKEQTAIKEVSPAIGAWKDGRGQIWDDVINHVALTPRPVQEAQDGFTAVLANLSTGQADLLCLSTADGTGFTLATDDDESDKKYDKVASDKLTGADDTDDDKPADDGKLTPADPAGGAAQELTEVKSLLAEMGAQLPEDTTEDKFLEHLRVALTAIKARLLREKQDDTEKNADREPQPNVGNGTTTPAPQMPQMMMATEGLSDLEKKLALKLGEGRRAEQVKRIDALAGRDVKPDVIADLRTQAGQVRMSLTADGDVADDELDRMLAMLERVTPKKSPFRVRLSTGQLEPAERKGGKSERVTVGGLEMEKKEAGVIEEMRKAGRNGAA
jgi:hypothetical protein